MSAKRAAPPMYPAFVQLIVGFVIPTIILLYASSPSRLGPVGAMLLALAFPVALEVYGLLRRRKPSVLSVISIIGILFIGGVSILGLGKEWLALRRSIIYAVAAIVLLVMLRFKPLFMESLLDRILEMEGVRTASRQRQTEAELMRYTRRAAYALAVICGIVAIASYVLTIMFITAPTSSSDFNAQYAELRILSLGVITVPFLIALTATLVYLIGKFEKLTGISAENLIKKRPNRRHETTDPTQKG